HPGFAQHEGLAGGPGSLSLSFGGKTAEVQMQKNILCLLGGIAFGFVGGYSLSRTTNADNPEVAAKLKAIDGNLADLKRGNGELQAEMVKIREHQKVVHAKEPSYATEIIQGSDLPAPG